MTFPWPGYLLALIAGAITPLAFAPFEFYPAAVLAPALLFAIWSRTTPAQAFLSGGLFGAGMFGAGVTWIFVSIHDYGYVNWGLSVFLTALFVIVLSVFPALAGYCAVRLISFASPGSRAFRMALVFPALWTLFEWARGWFLTGFPWLNLGYSQIDTPLSALAPVIGVYGVSLATAWSGALLAATFNFGRRDIKGAYLAGFVGVWLVCASMLHIEWTRPAGEALKVSIVQGNIAQDIKWDPDMQRPTFGLYAALTRRHWDSDLIIWPETALPAFYDQAVPFLQEMGEEARANHSDVLAGLVYQEPDSLRYYNSMVSIGSQERLYHKQHLVPFTEYLPLKGVFSGIVDFMNVPMSDFSAGSADQELLEAAGHKIGMSICFEDAFGEEMIRALPDATMLVNVSNDAWFGRSLAAHQHVQIARMRALETGRPLMRATNTGISALIDHTGKMQAVAPQFTEFVLTGVVQPMSGSTPYVRYGNYPALILVGMMLLMGFYPGRDQK